MSSSYDKLKYRTRLLLDEAVHTIRTGFRNDVNDLMRRVELAQMEQRILMSASPMAAVVADAPDSASVDTNSGEADQLTNEQAGQTGGSKQASEDAGGVDNSVVQSTVELVVIDPSADDYQQMVADLESQTDRIFEILILNPREDGIQQITDVLKDLRDVSAIHLVSHGDEGEILLGTSVLSQKSMSRYAAEIVTWQYSMTADADLLIYGCDLTASSDGIELTESLNLLLGADVAASNDATGQAALGGDWDLEQQVGQIETSVAFTAEAQSNWQGILSVSGADEVQVNTTTSNLQETSGENRGSQQAVAVAADGSYVVAWTSTDQDGSDTAVYARRFDSAGVALTGEIQVAQTVSDDQQWARVGSDAAGNFVVTWTSTNQDGTLQSVYARRFDSTGAALANEIRVNTTNSGTQKDSSIAVNASGDFVVAWQGNGPGDTAGIFYRRFNADGTAINGTDVRANSSDRGTEADPDVAINDSGQFAIAWHVGNSLYIRQFTANGTAVSDDVQVDNGLANALSPSVGIDAAGRTVIVYRTDGAGGIGQGVWGRAFNADGSPHTSWFQIADSDSTSPSLDMDAAGNFVVVWDKSGDADAKGVYMRHYSFGNSAQSDAILVNTENQTGNQHLASVAGLDTNNFVVVWSGQGANDTNGVFAKQFHNETPAVDLDVNDSSGATGTSYSANFNDGGGPVSVVDADAVLSDANDADLTSLVVTITNRGDGSSEILAADTTGTSITASFSTSTGRLTLSGVDTVANYQTVLRSITYNNSQNPASGISRTISFVANDGFANSNVATTTMSINGVQSATLTPAADTYIDSNSKNNNYGSATSLVVNKGGGGIGSERPLLRFDLTSLPSGATITGATLKLNATANSGVFDINVYELIEAWDEGVGNANSDAASWDDRLDGVAWTNAGGTFDPTIVATSNNTATGIHSWDITSLVQAWASGSKVNNGLILGSPDGGTETVVYDSSEGTTPPELVLLYTLPVNTPPSVSLLNTVSLPENTDTTASVKVADIVVTDDCNGTNTLGLSGADAARFVIVNGSELHLAAGTALDFETKQSYEVTVTVDDASIAGGVDNTASFTLSITDVNDNTPTVDVGQTFVVSEAAANGTSLGILTATDGDAGSTFTNWQITGGNIHGIFTINSSTGQITVNDNSNLDKATTPSYTLSVSVSDGTAVSAVENIVVNVLSGTTATQTIDSITIDGSIESAWLNATENTANNTTGNVTDATDLSAGFRTLWDSTNLYVLVNVTDANTVSDSGIEPWNDDIVELFIDGNLSRGAAFDGVDDFEFGFRFNDPGTVHIGSNSVNNSTGVTFQITPTAGGYLAEIAVPWTTLEVTPGVGTVLGLEVQVSDDDDGGANDGKIAWSDPADQAFQNPSTFGVVQLTGVHISTLTVDTASDISDGDTSSIAALYADKGSDGKISLREAILAANATTNGALPDRILFSISDPLIAGAHTINLTSALPEIDDQIIIDGTTEGDFSGSPIIVLNGSAAGAGAHGLRLIVGSDGSTIRGLAINQFDQDGIRITGSGSHNRWQLHRNRCWRRARPGQRPRRNLHICK